MIDTRVGIIGGGWSGIYTAKHCLEAGLKPTVFESHHSIGGQWLYEEDRKGGVRKDTITVSSKLYMSPSDFPYPEEAPEFLEASQVYQHFIDYVDHFKLTQCILCNQKVTTAYKDNDEWVIVTQEGEFRFDTIVIATGLNQVPKYPNDTFFENFTGKKHHGHDVKEPGHHFDNQSLLIIGGSDTASDLACDLCHKAQVTVSVRNGTWFQDRVVDAIEPDFAGYPADMAYNRFIDKVFKWTQYDVLKYQGFIKRIEDNWGICGSGVPEWFTPAGYLNTYYTKSRNLVHKVHEGLVTPRRGVVDIDGQNVFFEGDPNPHHFDHIIFCTGYKPTLNFDFPYEPHQDLYRKVLLTQDPSVAFVGYIRPYLTSITMLVEMQTRWLAQVLSGQLALPSHPEMLNQIQSDEAYRHERFPLYADRMPFLVDPYIYSNTLAKDINQHPNLLKLWLTHPILAFHVTLDSWNQFFYRLEDPSPEKRKIALEQIESLKSHPMSHYVRKAPIYGIVGVLKNMWNWKEYFSKRSKQEMPQPVEIPQSCEAEQLSKLPSVFHAYSSEHSYRTEKDTGVPSSKHRRRLG